MLHNIYKKPVNDIEVDKIKRQVLEKLSSTEKKLSPSKTISVPKEGIFDVRLTDGNWACYEGFFKDGKKHGVGKIEFVDGRTFEGEFEEGEVSGYGILVAEHQGISSLLVDDVLGGGCKKVFGMWEENCLVRVL